MATPSAGPPPGGFNWTLCPCRCLCAEAEMRVVLIFVSGWLIKRTALLKGS